MIVGITIGAIFVAIMLILITMGVKIVPQTEVYIVERFGSFRKILKNGINFIIPVVDKIVLKETIKERALDFPAQDVITKDNVTMKIDTVVFLQITDPKLFAYGVVKPFFAIENLTSTTLRNLVGDLELDETLTSRDSVNEKLREILDEATDPWGVKVIRVELKNILPPEDIRRAMEKQMRAEREKREQILVAQGEKQAAILSAEGSKAAQILRAEGNKEAAILNAEGIKKSVELINASKPTTQALTIKSFETLSEVSKGMATTLLIPSEITEVSKLASVFATVNKATSKSINKKQNLANIIDNIEGKKSKK